MIRPRQSLSLAGERLPSRRPAEELDTAGANQRRSVLHTECSIAGTNSTIASRSGSQAPRCPGSRSDKRVVRRSFFLGRAKAPRHAGPMERKLHSHAALVAEFG